MQRLGFIHDMLDVKVLILFVMARVNYPVNIQQIYELCYQDDCLSYFDVCTAVPEMVKSGHLKEAEGECYVVTEKGKADGALTEDSIAFTVKQRADNAVSRFNEGIMTRLTEAVEDAGFRYFDWNVDSDDAGNARKSETVYRNVISGVANNRVSVVLQHDIHRYSVDAVEDILVWGFENGYTFLPLQEDSPTIHHGLNN